LRLPATIWPSSGLHRRLTFRSRFPIDLRLSSAIFLPALPSNSTSNSHRLSDLSSLAFVSISSFRLRPILGSPSSRPSTRVSDQPSGSTSNQPATRAACRFSSPAFRPISSFRLRSIFQLNLPADLRLASPINSPVLPSNLTSDSHRLLHSPAASEPPCDLRRRPILQLRLRVNLRLSPLVNSPAVPSGQPSTFADCQPSSLRFRTQPPTPIGCCILWLHPNRSATCAAYRSSSSPSCQPLAFASG